MKQIDFHGVHLFSVTPTDASGAIAPDLFEEHFEHAIAAGVSSITVFGSTGAIGSFEEGERKRVAEAAVRLSAGRVPVIVGTGAITTAETLRLSQHAADSGAAAILVVPITYWPLTEHELLRHYQTITALCALPLVLYNNPRTTGVDMTPSMLASLSALPQVVAIKESAPDVSRISETKRLSGDSVAILTGRDPQIIDAMRVGATGWFSGGANVTPALSVELFSHIKCGRWEQAEKLFSRMLPLIQFAAAKGGVRAAHTALQVMGRSMGAPRAPLGLLDSEDREQLKRLLNSLDIPTPEM
jgi:4-hydroxy-tetrahydrodipicolinate synthase